jgi:beta-glucosidase
LLTRLTLQQRIALFTSPAPPSEFVSELNLKSFWWDITCIQGLSLNQANPVHNVTVFPNAIAQAASFDLDLVARIARATAVEARIINSLNYNASGGTTWQARSCDGGPLANTVHDPRWGR